MYKKILILLSLIVIRCGNPDQNKQKNSLHATIDSLEHELNTSQQWVLVLQEVGALMDTIDSRRKLLRVNMIEGTAYNEYVLRMKSIQRYIQDGQHKIKNLENILDKSKESSSMLSSITNRLKADLKVSSEEIKKLQQSIEQYQQENMVLTKEVSFQKILNNDKEKAINKKKKELVQSKENIQKLIIEKRIVEGNAYYTKGEILAEMAKRTKFAPRKKKETNKEALKMYRKALSLGVTKASSKIKTLQKNK